MARRLCGPFCTTAQTAAIAAAATQQQPVSRVPNTISVVDVEAVRAKSKGGCGVVVVVSPINQPINKLQGCRVPASHSGPTVLRGVGGEGLRSVVIRAQRFRVVCVCLGPGGIWPTRLSSRSRDDDTQPRVGAETQQLADIHHAACSRCMVMAWHRFWFW